MKHRDAEAVAEMLIANTGAFHEWCVKAMDIILQHNATPGLVMLGARLGALRDAAQSAEVMFTAVLDELRAGEKEVQQ